MIVKNVILTDEQRKGFILLANSPDPFGNYLYSSELDLIMNKQTGALMTYFIGMINLMDMKFLLIKLMNY